MDREVVQEMEVQEMAAGDLVGGISIMRYD